MIATIKLYNIFRNDLSLSEDKAQEFIHAIDDLVKLHRPTTANSQATNGLVQDEIHRLELKK